MLRRLRLGYWRNCPRSFCRAHRRPVYGAKFSTSAFRPEASYSDWLLGTSKSLNLFYRTEEGKTETDSTDAASNDRPRVPLDFTVLQRNDKETIEVLGMKAQGRLSQVSEKLQDLRAENKILGPELILEVLQDPDFDDESLWFKEVGALLPLVDSFMSLESCTYYKLLSKLKHYNSILNLYEDIMIREHTYQLCFIQVAFHLNDFGKLKTLSNMYLKNPTDSTTVRYIVKGFALNFEVDAAKEIFVGVCGMRKDWDVRLLEDTFSSFVAVDSLFDNYMHVLQAWILSRNQLPSEKAMILMLRQCYRFGTPEELREIDNLIHRYSLGDGAMINMTKLQFFITNRDKMSFKKIIFEDDIVIFNNIARSLLEEGRKEELSDYYYSMASYFSRYSDMKYAELVFYKMRQDGIPLDQRFYRLLSRRYVMHENFLQLLRFLMSSQQRIQFHLKYLVDIFECFVKTYPHYAIQFADSYRSWIDSSKHIDESLKHELLNRLKINRLQSLVAPLGFGDKQLNRRKYTGEWNLIGQKRDRHKSTLCSKQVEFRVEQGFKDLIRRGIKPDFNIIEETFRRLDLLYKTKILELAQTIRMEQKHQNRLSMINIGFATKKELKKFFKYNLSTLNANNKIVFGRFLFNNNLASEAKAVFESIDGKELNDRSYLVILNFALRNALKSGDIESFTQKLDDFPLKEVTLSPYLLQQCMYIEKELNKKLSHSQEPDKIETAVKRLRQFIGDVQIILDKDKQELEAKVKEMFGFLDSWITTND